MLSRSQWPGRHLLASAEGRAVQKHRAQVSVNRQRGGSWGTHLDLHLAAAMPQGEEPLAVLLKLQVSGLRSLQLLLKAGTSGLCRLQLLLKAGTSGLCRSQLLLKAGTSGLCRLQLLPKAGTSGLCRSQLLLKAGTSGLLRSQLHLSGCVSGLLRSQLLLKAGASGLLRSQLHLQVCNHLPRGAQLLCDPLPISCCAGSPAQQWWSLYGSRAWPRGVQPALRVMQVQSGAAWVYKMAPRDVPAVLLRVACHNREPPA